MSGMFERNITLSVVIPCYNGRDYIQSLLESLIIQTSLPQRILVIDDGSTDGSGDNAREMPGVEVIAHRENRGLSAARNTAITACDTDVILFVDVDTKVPSDFVARCQSLYTLYPDMAGIGGRAIETKLDSIHDMWRKIHMTQGFGEEVMLDAPMLWGVCSSYRRKILQSMGGFREEFRCNGEDVDMGLRLKKTGHRLLYHPELSVRHLKGDTEESLHKTLYRWFYWGAMAHRRNGHYPLPGLVKTVLLQISRTRHLKERNRQLLALEYALIPTRLKAISDACRWSPAAARM